ncbi:Gamma-parvin [Lonchura striata]|uniref:Gamma-parvin n=1 Tax=Lonchura striata TaxID=40157 RepID=A0A218UJW1_9PASE|nr:Gamma-parvin [Lonchura striata domestica]
MDPDFLNAFTQPSTLDRFLTENVIAKGEKRKLIKPTSSNNPRLEELKLFLTDWINGTLKEEHIVVKSLEEDLYDGLVLHHLLAILAKDLLSTLHLLVAIAKHFEPTLALPPNVQVETIIIEALLQFVDQHVGKLGLNVKDIESQLHNVNLALELLAEGGLLNFPVNSEDIVNGDTKAIMRVLYSLYSNYRTKEA